MTLLESSPRRDWIDHVLPWLILTLAAAAFVTGVRALVSAEYCHLRRGSYICVTGVTAQLQGAATLAVAGALALVPLFRWSVKKVAVFIALAATAFALLIASLVLR